MAELITEYTKRPSWYALSGGVGEMGLGILFLGMSILIHIANRYGQHSIWSWKPTVLICGAVLLVLVLVAEATAKNRITLRRTGYVKYRQSRAKAAVAIMIAAILAAIVAVLISHFWKQSPHGQNLQLLLAGSSMLALYAYWTKLDRPWRWIVALAMTFGPLASHSILSDDPGQWLSSDVVIGMCWLISGAITFWLYLRRTRPAEGAR